MARRFVCGLTVMLPWSVRRQVLARVFGYRIHRTSRIGISLVCPRMLVMGAHSRIGHLTVCHGLDYLGLGERSTIGNLNWVTGRSADDQSYFAAGRARKAELVLGAQSAVTNRHLIDCTNAVHIGHHATVAGYRSQILTHSIDVQYNRQDSQPITIGSYTFVGTQCIILGGSSLPPRSGLAAMSLLNAVHTDSLTLYGGVPARPVKQLGPEYEYFRRTEGVVY
jgi:acetyltransferase-like isoleucine patch superfamily enzyme